MKTHPCIVCDGPGWFTDGRCIILCNCAQARVVQHLRSAAENVLAVEEPCETCVSGHCDRNSWCPCDFDCHSARSAAAALLRDALSETLTHPQCPGTSTRETRTTAPETPHRRRTSTAKASPNPP